MILTPSHLRKNWYWILGVSIALLIVLTITTLSFGAAAISSMDLWSWLNGTASDRTEIILTNLRLPRTLLALCVGAMLGSCGAATQGLFRNPLADPSLIGVSAGASAGASIVIVLLSSVQWSIVGLSLVSVGAFIGGLASVALVYRIASGPHGTSVSTMLLAGIAVTFIAGSVSNVLEFMGNNEMLRRISLWRMGGLDGADFSHIAIISSVSVVVLTVLTRHTTALNALLLGESEARHLGIPVNLLKKIIVVTVAAGVGTSVALAGSIIFVGLVVPHMVRLVIGPNHRYLIPMSALLGAMILVIADAFARTIIAPTELPVGLVTTLIGAPVFISLLRNKHR